MRAHTHAYTQTHMHTRHIYTRVHNAHTRVYTLMHTVHMHTHMYTHLHAHTPSSQILPRLLRVRTGLSPCLSLGIELALLPVTVTQASTSVCPASKAEFGCEKARGDHLKTLDHPVHYLQRSEEPGATVPICHGCTWVMVGGPHSKTMSQTTSGLALCH